MPTLTFNIDASLPEPIYAQIYKYMKSEIEQGNFVPKIKLPSTRSLADHLQVSRNTVEMAYGQLMDEGYIEASPKRGYFVCDISMNMPSFAMETDAGITNDRQAEDEHFRWDFSPYGVDLESFPYNTWRKLMRDILYDEQVRYLFESGHPQGDIEFRRAIANYLHQSRGVRCQVEQIIVGAGIDYLLLLLTQLLGRETVFALEDPSYMQAARILKHLNFKTHPIPLDSHGMNIRLLEQTEANVAYVTPSHHFPMGIVMPIKRRQEFLKWAGARQERFIIEDDYDSEFRYKGKPIPSLQGIDSQQKVIYLGTFSKAIAPSIRISYMVLPPKLFDKYLKNYSFYSCTVPRTEQKQLTDFIAKGFFERHLNRMRNIYKNKRDYILHELAPFDGIIKISGENSGLHVIIHFNDGRSEDEILQTAAENGLRLYGISAYVLDRGNCPGSTILLGYANLTMKQLEKQMNVFIEKVL